MFFNKSDLGSSRSTRVASASGPILAARPALSSPVGPADAGAASEARAGLRPDRATSAAAVKVLEMMAESFDPTAITVALATFNRREMLERSVRSVLDERRVPIRLQVHDNASTDGTEAYMRALVAADPRVTYTRNPSNIGGENNIVGSLRAVRTEFYVPLADDDYLLPDFLHDAYTIIRADQELGAVAFYAEVRDEAGRVLNYWPNDVGRMLEGKQRPAEHLRQWMLTSHYSQQAVLWRSSVLAHVGDPFFHTGMPSDVDFQAQAIAKFPMFVVKRPGGVFSCHSGQASHGLGVVDVMSWAKLFGRLDKAVETFGLFTPDEYLPLRNVMWQRMQASWRRAGKTPIPLPTLARLAVSAGFSLGDWELAFYLVAETRKLQAEIGSARIPAHIERGLRAVEMIFGSVQREQAAAAQVHALATSIKTLQDAVLTVSADRNRLAADLTALQMRQTRFEPAERLRTDPGAGPSSAAVA